jgi:hypothetical protein
MAKLKLGQKWNSVYYNLEEGDLSTAGYREYLQMMKQ